MTDTPVTHWLTKYDGDRARPYLVMCSCPAGSDHDVLGTPMPAPDRQLAIARHHYGTEPTGLEETAPAMCTELQEEVFGLVRLAVGDPGAFVRRGRERGASGTIYESIPAWGARAVLAAIERHPTVAIRPDRPTQWAYDQACKALQKHQERGDETEERLAALRNPPSDALPDDRDGVVRAWFELYCRWRYQVERADRAAAALWQARQNITGGFALTNADMADLADLQHDDRHEECGLVFQRYFTRMLDQAQEAGR